MSCKEYGSPSLMRRITVVTQPKEVCLHNSASNSSFRQACSLLWGSVHSATGGCNSDAKCIGKNVCLQAWDCIKGNLSRWKVTGGADFYAKPTLLIGMRKGSVLVRRVAPKSSYAVLVGGGCSNADAGRKKRLITPQEERYVVCCIVYSKRVCSNWVSTSQ